MSVTRVVTAAVVSVVLTGCGTTGQNNGVQLRKVSDDEAFAFIREQKEKFIPQSQESDAIYVQPLNKSESCKLPTSKEQLDRSNFRSFWDGQCRNGFAYGLGREVAVSDTHHLEEITIYGDGGKVVDAPAVTYDFVHHLVTYRYVKGDNLQNAIFTEAINNEVGKFNVNYSLGLWDRDGSGQGIYWSPFGFQVVSVNIKENVVYRFTKNDIVVGEAYSNTPIYGSDTLEKASGTAGGYAMAAFSNGQIRHFILKDGRPEFVLLPETYTSRISSLQQEISNAQARIAADIEKAKRMEREYLHLACNGKHGIRGLDKEISTKICVWRSQFQEPFKDASKIYGEKLEAMKSEAKSQAERRLIQEQINNSRLMADAAQRQASAAENANVQNLLNQSKPTTCYTNFNITTCY